MSDITIRELPSEEFYRLIGHECMAGAPIPDGAAADNTRCIVAEDAAGEILAVVWAANLVFMEGFWVRPDHRSSTLPFRTYTHLSTLLTSLGVPVLHTWTTTPDHAALTERLGFTPLPVVTLQKPLPCPQPSPSLPPLPSPPQASVI